MTLFVSIAAFALAGAYAAPTLVNGAPFATDSPRLIKRFTIPVFTPRLRRRDSEPTPRSSVSSPCSTTPTVSNKGRGLVVDASLTLSLAPATLPPIISPFHGTALPTITLSVPTILHNITLPIPTVTLSIITFPIIILPLPPPTATSTHLPVSSPSPPTPQLTSESSPEPSTSIVQTSSHSDRGVSEALLPSPGAVDLPQFHNPLTLSGSNSGAFSSSSSSSSSPFAPTATRTSTIAQLIVPTVPPPTSISGPSMLSGTSMFLPIHTSPSAPSESEEKSLKHTNIALLGSTIVATTCLLLTIAFLVYLVKRHRRARGTTSAAHGLSLIDRIRGFTAMKVSPFCLPIMQPCATHNFTRLKEDKISAAADHAMIERSDDRPPVHTGVLLITASRQATICSDDSLRSEATDYSDAVASSTALGEGWGPD